MTSILVLGSGFGGIHAYRRLFELFGKDANVSVTLISDIDYFWFTPMAHEVATGNLSLGSVTYSLRSLPQTDRFRFVHAQVKEVDFDTQKVSYISCVTHREHARSYDYLISALGSRTHFLGVPGAREHTLPLKTREDVVRIKKEILRNFGGVQDCPQDEQKRRLTFAVVGGGATGVELAGELHDLIQSEFKRVFPDSIDNASIHLFHSRDRLLHEEDVWLSKKAQKMLEKRGVVLHLSSRITEVGEKRIYWGDESLDVGSVFWTSGVIATQVSLVCSKEVSVHPRNNRIHVTSNLTLAHYPQVFVVGDQAWCEDTEERQPYPMRAQFAVRQGVCAAQNIKLFIEGKKMKEFAWKDKGFIVSLGEKDALARVSKIKFGGVVAWWLYRTVYIPQILGLRNKIRVVFEWTLNLFLPRDLSDS